MSAVSIDRFFRLLSLFETNRYVQTYKNFQDEANRMGEEDRSTNLYQNALNLDGVNNFSITEDGNIISTALQARQKTRKFFIRTMIPGSYAFNTKDMDLFREFIVDWASSIKTQKDLMKQCSDAFALDDEDIDKAIKGFGIDWCNKKSIPHLPRSARANFLYAICELYKIKGSPISITRALYHMGIANTIIREHWVEKVPYINNQIQIRAVATSKHLQNFNYDNNRYDLSYKGSADDVIIPWDTFLDKMQEIAEPHWWYKHDQIVDIDNDPNTWLKLPSITPYFGVISYNDLNKYNLIVSFLEKLLDDQFNQFLHGDKDYIPQEIGLDGFNQELTQRKIQIDGFNDPLTLLEAYLAYSYCQIRYDEYMAFSKLKDFIVQRQVHATKDMPMEYRYPYGYLNFIYELYQNKDSYVNDTPVTIDMILKQYPGDLSHYYLSNNEFFKWWDKYHAGEDISETGKVFYSQDYKFRIIEDQDRSKSTTGTTYDKIFRYNGNRELDYRRADFQYEEAIGDFNRESNQKLHRGTEYDDLKSYYPCNATVNNDKKLGDYVFDHIATYFRNISEYDRNYTENYKHDGSQITPTYLKKWPETKSWNWAIDSYFYYMSYTPTKWSRWSVESQWNPIEETGYIGPNSGPVNVTFVGEYVYYEQYVYAYISENKWVRWVVETDWGYCDGPIRPNGSFRLDNDFAKQFIVGQVSKATANKYLNGKLEHGIDRIALTIDPYSIRSASKNVTLSVNEFKDYILALDSHVDVTGNLIKNTSHFKHDQYIYSYVYDITTKTYRWVRKPCETEWSYNGAKVYQGEYQFPGLDLTDRYDAERILRGKYAFNIEELEKTAPDEFIDVNDSNKVLVCQPNIDSANPLDRYPRSYEYDEVNSVWVPTTEVKDGSVVPTNDLDKIRLGFNNKIMDWIDNVRCVEEEMYGDLADEILSVTSTYISIQFQDNELNIAGIYKDIANNGLYHDAIEFYKPKRARLLYFSVEFSIDTRYDNSLFLEDIPETTKIIHEIQDHVPHDDLIYLDNQVRKQTEKHAYYDNEKREYVEYDVEVSSKSKNEAVRFSQYSESIPQLTEDIEYYIGNCPHQFVNGFYRKITNKDGSIYWINEHNVVIQRLYNQNPIWSKEYYAEWIIARRKITGLSRCDAWYLNYINADTNNFDKPPENGRWFTQKTDPDDPYSEVYSIQLIKVANITSLNILNREHRESTANSIIKTGYTFNSLSTQLTQYVTELTNNEISWNTLFQRPSSKIVESKWFTLHPRKVDPAYCVDDIRPLYPKDNQVAAAPESIAGGRYDDADYDQSKDYIDPDHHMKVTKYDGYNKEYRHSFREEYPYEDNDHMIITDAPNPEFDYVPIRSREECKNEFQSTSEFSFPRFIAAVTEATASTTIDGKLYYLCDKLKVARSEDISDVRIYLRKFTSKAKRNSSSVAINPLTGVPNGFVLYTGDYEIRTDIENDGNITGGIFLSSYPNGKYEILIVSTKPGKWWINDPLDWYPGPGHRPTYIGIQDIEEDPYPCHDWADCCDYYDTGCRHDGPTNPHIEIWETDGNNGQWAECATAHGNFIDSDYDEWTHYHKKFGYIDRISNVPYTDPPFTPQTVPPTTPRTQAFDFCTREVTEGRVLEDPGDTYCNECGVPSVSPDQTTRLLPEILKASGVYHETLKQQSRDNTKYFRGISSWNSWINTTFEFSSPENTTMENWDKIYVSEKPHSLYPGLILTHGEQSSKIVKILDKYTIIVDNSFGDLSNETFTIDKFIPYKPIKDDNNNYFDYGYISDDGEYQLRHSFNKTTATHRWEVTTTESSPDILYVTKPRLTAHLPEEVENQPYTWVSRPDAFVEGTEDDIAEDIFLTPQGEETSLFFSNNTIISFRIKNPSIDLPPDYDLWSLIYIKETDTTGYVYIYTPNGWKQIDQLATTINITKDDNNYFGYWLRKQKSSDKYDLYLHVSCHDRIGWVILSNVRIESSITNYGYTYNNDWIARSRTLYKVCHMKLENPLYELSSDTHYCADPIHYAETYDGAMLAAFGKNRTRCTAREKVFVDIYDYCTTIQSLLTPEEESNSSSSSNDEEVSPIYYRKIWQTYQDPVTEETRYRINFLKLNDNHKNDNPPQDWEFCDDLIYKLNPQKFKKSIKDETDVYTADVTGSYYQFEVSGF